ncbi:MAG: hypothetical protein JO054_05075 [Actinobacteria bacterium]|nr:hypothetical protein [Actinomycetota bacterium]
MDEPVGVHAEGVGEHEPGVHVVERHVARLAHRTALQRTLGEVDEAQRYVGQREPQERQRRLALDLALGPDDALATAACQMARLALGSCRRYQLVVVPGVVSAGEQQRQVAHAAVQLSRGEDLIQRRPLPGSGGHL